jgi:hypothetical protein
MDTQVGVRTSTRVTRPGGPDAKVEHGYRSFTDEQLMLERTKKQRQLDRLTMDPGPSPEVGRLFVTLDREIDRINDEVVRRGSLGARMPVITVVPDMG